MDLATVGPHSHPYPRSLAVQATLERAHLAQLRVRQLQHEIDRVRELMEGPEPRRELALELLRLQVRWDAAHLQYRHALAAAEGETPG